MYFYKMHARQKFGLVHEHVKSQPFSPVSCFGQSGPQEDAACAAAAEAASAGLDTERPHARWHWQLDQESRAAVLANAAARLCGHSASQAALWARPGSQPRGRRVMDPRGPAPSSGTRRTPRDQHEPTLVFRRRVLKAAEQPQRAASQQRRHQQPLDSPQLHAQRAHPQASRRDRLRAGHSRQGWRCVSQQPIPSQRARLPIHSRKGQRARAPRLAPGSGRPRRGGRDGRGLLPALNTALLPPLQPAPYWATHGEQRRTGRRGAPV